MSFDIRRFVDLLIDRREDGTLFVLNSDGDVIHSPVSASDDEVIQWALDYAPDEYLRQALENLFDITGEIS